MYRQACSNCVRCGSTSIMRATKGTEEAYRIPNNEASSAIFKYIAVVLAKEYSRLLKGNKISLRVY